MRQVPLAVILSICLCVTAEATDNPKTVSSGELIQFIAAAQGTSDADLAQKFQNLALTDRLNGTRLADLANRLPGDKSRLELMVIADKSIFLLPPADETPAEASPNAASARDMLLKLVDYVNRTVRQLPNLMATRFSNGFEDQPREEWSGQYGVETRFYQPLHWVGSLKTEVTYRDRKEIEEKGVNVEKRGNGVGGLVTSGEFGPILSMVLADAVKGKITWMRWEKDGVGTLAVFHYQVPEEKSHYYVRFCCIPAGLATTGSEIQMWNERAAYHGDIVFSPADGSIRLLTLEADLAPGALVSRAGIAIEYTATDIGGRSYICPARSVSILQSHSLKNRAAISHPNYDGPVKTFLNDVTFSNYRRFGSETKISTN